MRFGTASFIPKKSPSQSSLLAVDARRCRSPNAYSEAVEKLSLPIVHVTWGLGGLPSLMFSVQRAAVRWAIRPRELLPKVAGRHRLPQMGCSGWHDTCLFPL